MVVFGHGATLDKYGTTLFTSAEAEDLTMEELGFAVLEVKEGEILVHHVFTNFF